MMTSIRIALAALSTSAALFTSAQPLLVRDFWPGNVVPTLLNHGRPNGFRMHNDRLLLFANDGPTLGKLFALDNLSGSVEELTDVGGVVGYTTTNGGIITSGENIYFFTQSGLDYALYARRNGTTELLTTIPGQFVFYHNAIPLPGGKLLFPGSDPTHGYEPWVTDGTAAGTHMVKDIFAGSTTGLGDPFPLFQGFDFDGRAYFLATDGSNGVQLWTSDGTEVGTTLFANVNDPDDSGAITLLWSRNETRFVVTATEGLLASDGTTTQIIHGGDNSLAHIPGLNYAVSADGYMYFTALENSDWNLYRTQGTTATTELVYGGVPAQGFPFLTELNGVLFALALVEGTNVLARIDPATHQLSVVYDFTAAGGGAFGLGNGYGFRSVGQHIYFCGRITGQGQQYWKSDGTAAGTQMVHEFMPTAINGGPDAASQNMISFRDHFVFAANDETVGVELFAVEGAVGISEQGRLEASINAWVDGNGDLMVRGSEHLGTVRLLDGAGREVLRRDGIAREQARIPVGGLAPGLYVVRTEHEGIVGVKKVVLY